MDKHKRDRRIIIPLSRAELDVIDDFRFASRQPSRAEAIRELLRRALNHRGVSGVLKRDVKPESG